VAESAEPYREFIREITLRIERAVREMVRESRREREVVLAEIRDFREEWRGETREWRDEMRELHEESRAQRKALLAILDRLNGGAQPT